MTDRIDEYYIAKTLNLARKAAGLTSPNPMVGSVIVKNSKVIGSGYHKKAGGPHAEIIALKMAGSDAKGATLYVSLEPCSHFGKTPPCVESIKKYGISRVVAAMKDPNPLVSGKGFKYLKDNGIDVKYGVLEDRAKKLNEIFLKNISAELPFITIKLAVSIDGKIGFSHKNAAVDSKNNALNNTQFYLSSEKSLRYTHNLRLMHDAIMVSANTVISDNPRLNIRYAKDNIIADKKFAKIIIDSNLMTPADSKLFKYKNDGDKIFIFTSFKYSEEKLKRKKLLEQKGAIIKEVLYNNSYEDRLKNYSAESAEKNGFTIGSDCDVLQKKHYLDIACIFKECAAYGITSIFVEPGPNLFAYLISNKLYDKLIFNITPYLIGNINIIDSTAAGFNNSAGNSIGAFDLINFSNINLNKFNNNLQTGNAVKDGLNDLYTNKQLIKLKNLDIKKTGDDIFLIYYPES
ncbi:MAG: bifunctional diaminohydroxyphosphoribosylaminopyrimidine deaminase/5-amino-6-(5-phosphoribosylamino)uracil reductase RibD [Candidatus Acididesulfobacter guangdongensis]|uniref:Riboflavin biosynthesis protein RibD n=1 Tax=Acididesulfobacter guangdongensis TaxID=2597225 RepID=A0A519BIX4_ACIG2|nr:MAG: bifunctional diaminohydroxyphosphoribosylaminopyrimidine deaminase/5-amino-6-(5-phosphoribosylamino)uracil reductase RibD [Candidatus Acididesulfobacter guangdongensis]